MDFSNLQINGGEEVNQQMSIEEGLAELKNIINHSADLYHQLKKIKFEFLTQTCELYSRIDYPSIMMESCRKEVNQNVPSVKDF